MRTLYTLSGFATMVLATLVPLGVGHGQGASQLSMLPRTYLGAGPSAQPLSYGQTTYGTPAFELGQPGYSPPMDPGSYKPAFSSLSPFRPQVGVEVQIGGQWSSDPLLGQGQAGIGLDLMFRVHPRLTLELGAGYHHGSSTNSYLGQYARTDVPIFTGFRFYLGPLDWSAAPYLVAALGADCAHARQQPEAVWVLEGQGGLGVEGRLGRHFSIDVDVRGFGRTRPNIASALYLTDTYGNLIPALNSQSGFLFNTGCAFYF